MSFVKEHARFYAKGFGGMHEYNDDKSSPLSQTNGPPTRTVVIALPDQFSYFDHVNVFSIVHRVENQGQMIFHVW
jgi:hypothetical protein